jgi:RNA polymerase sigma-70 factor, ECF subfamily
MQQADVFHAYKPLLFSIAYNMLGSIMDAEDCVQEAFQRWYGASHKGEIEAVRSPKSYLSTIVTRLCIDHLRSARAQRERCVGIWLPEPLVTTDETSLTDMAERSEALSLAFLRLLEQLSPLERAVFLLHQVFDYDYGNHSRRTTERRESGIFRASATYRSAEQPKDQVMPQITVCSVASRIPPGRVPKHVWPLGRYGSPREQR